QFAASGFDVKHLFRAICNSETYQRTSKPVAGNESDRVLFSHVNVKSFTPEQLYDSLVAVLGEPGNNRGGRAAAGGKGAPRTPRSRRPTPAEVARLNSYIQKAGSADEASGDILWALLNSSEFTLNH